MFSIKEMRDAITGKTQYRKCPNCDNNGKIYWDENGEGVCAFPRTEWGNNYESGTCDCCEGLGFVKIAK